VSVVRYSDQIPDDLLDPVDKQEIIRYLRQVHGDIEDAKVTLLFVADEQDFDVEPDDIEAVTDSEPVETFK